MSGLDTLTHTHTHTHTHVTLAAHARRGLMIKCGRILRCRLWMQTNALSRQVALLAEPKTPLESSVFYYEH